MLDRIFRLQEHGSTVGREISGGVTTFIAMCYIVAVQPVVLSNAGMDHGGVFVATCVCSAFACVLMGLWSNLPVALAPAMGHNVFFAFTVCGAAAMGGMGWSWQEALAANMIAGAVFILLAATGFQEAIIRGIPACLKYAIAVGIGLLIAFVGLQWGGLVVDDPAVYVKVGKLSSPVALLTLFGLVVTSVMLVRGIRGALLYGVLLTAIVGLVGSHHWGEDWGYRLTAFKGKVVSGIPETGGTVFGVFDGMRTLFSEHSFASWVAIIFIFLMLDIFDTVGTLIGVTERAGLAKDGQIPRVKPALISDGVGTVAGTLMGTSTVTSYIESAAGINAGARTGLAAVVTGLFFVATLFFYPLVEMVGGSVAVSPASLGVVGATDGALVFCHPVIAPVLVIVGCYMMVVVGRIAWDDMTEAIPAFLTIVVMQFALSISHGIAWGFISYVLLKLVAGKRREIHPLVAIFAVCFVVFLVVE